MTLIFPLSPLVQVRGERTNGCCFACTVNGRAGNPLTHAELFRMIDPPSFMSGITFCTVKKAHEH
ncbi:MAG: hypothetical protein ACTHKP_04905 [Nitrososphaeraceae archaeon]